MASTTGTGLHSLAYIPRWLAGVSCYVAFGLGGLLLSLTVIPVLRVCSSNPQQRAARVQRTVHRMFGGFVTLLTWSGVIKVTSQDLHRLNGAKGKVIIANHPTLVDVVVLISLMPNVGCIVKQSLWRNPLLRAVLSSAGYIPNRGADLLLKDCQALLHQGTCLIIFPEGTRTQQGAIINPFARGAANIALRTKTDLIPIVLRTNAVGLTKQQPWYEIPRQTIGMHVEVGETIAHIGYDAGPGGEAKMARQLTRDLENYYKQQLDTNYELTKRN